MSTTPDPSMPSRNFEYQSPGAPPYALVRRQDAEAAIAALQEELEEQKRLTAQAKEGIHAVTEVAASLQAEIELLCHERSVLQKISARRAGALERVGLHADCTMDEASALQARLEAAEKLLASIQKAHAVASSGASFTAASFNKLLADIDAHLAASKGAAA